MANRMIIDIKLLPAGVVARRVIDREIDTGRAANGVVAAQRYLRGDLTEAMFRDMVLAAHVGAVDGKVFKDGRGEWEARKQALAPLYHLDYTIAYESVL